MRRAASRRRAAQIAALRDALVQAGSAARAPESFFAWAALVPEPKTGRLDFGTFPFQRELYAAATDDREVVVMKSTQIGVSAFALRWALFQADVHGRTALYVFPTRTDVRDFAAARIKPVIEGSDYLRPRQRPADPNNRGLIGIGRGLVYLRGSESKPGLDSVDADVVVFDEYDTLVARNIPDAERRVTGPLSAGLIRRVGVPSVHGFGIARLYERSDRRQWHVRCQACGLRQTVDFFKNVDLEKAIRVCAKCRKPIDVGVGEWVAEFPDRDIRGYHVTRLIAPTARLDTIIAASRARAAFQRQVFHNKDLGLPFEPEEGRLSRSVLKAAQSAREFSMLDTYSGESVVTMGIDVASKRDLHVRTSEHLGGGVKRGIFIGTVDGFDDLDGLMDRFGVHLAVVDHLPEGRLARAFAERYPGRVYLVAYDTSARPRGPEIIKVDDEMAFATVRRLEVIDATMAQFREQRNLLPLDLPDEYFEHLQALVRLSERDEFGADRVTYKAAGEDDFAQAEIYDTAATMIWEYRQRVGHLGAETHTTLDELVPFERSNLGAYDPEAEYDPGPREDGWDVGYE